MNPSLSPGAERSLVAYLDAVRSEMARAGHDAAEIDAVLEDLHDQACEMASTGNASPLSGDAMERALAELDAPHSFGDPAGATTSEQASVASSTSLQRLGWLSALTCVVTLALAVLVGVVRPEDDELGGTLLILGPLAALVAGAIARRTAPGRFGLVVSLIVLGGIGVAFLLD